MQIKISLHVPIGRLARCLLHVSFLQFVCIMQDTHQLACTVNIHDACVCLFDLILYVPSTSFQPDFYGDLVYKLKKSVGSYNFSAQFIKIISQSKIIDYNINVLQQTACSVVNPITVGNFAFLFNSTPVGRTSDSMMVPT